MKPTMPALARLHCLSISFKGKCFPFISTFSFVLLLISRRHNSYSGTWRNRQEGRTKRRVATTNIDYSLSSLLIHLKYAYRPQYGRYLQHHMNVYRPVNRPWQSNSKHKIINVVMKELELVSCMIVMIP